MVVAACGPGPTPPPADVASGPVKCETGSRALTEPELVGWDSNARGLLNSQRRFGAIAVHFEAKGCDVQLEVLPRCIAPDRKYEYTPYFASEKKVAHDKNELFAKIPVGAATLAGAMRQGESLRADTANVGVASLPPDATFKASDLKGPDCARATHVVGRLYLGAFAIATGETRDIDAAATVFGVGAGGKSSSLKSIGREEGDLAECDKAKLDGKERPSCSVPLRLGLLPLLDVTSAVGAGGATASFTFDGVKVGDPITTLLDRPDFKKTCDKDPSRDGRDFYVWLPRECRGSILPDGTAVLAFGPHDDKSMPIETLMVLGGTYFNARSTFPLQVGDPAAKASGVFGAPKKTFDLPTEKGVVLNVQIHRDDVAVVVLGGKVLGYVVGKMQDAPGEKTVWAHVVSTVEDDRNELLPSAKARKSAGQWDLSSAAATEQLGKYDEKRRNEMIAGVGAINTSRAALCTTLSAACKAKDAPVRDCNAELSKRYDPELKPKCIERMQKWIDCMAKNTSKITSCVPLKVGSCDDEEEAVFKCH